jgi:cell pole-organizing protein PopZ
MNQPAKAQEPTMEEILASIRRIIADDDTGKPAPKAVEVPPPPVAVRPEPPPPPRPAPAPPPPPAPEPAMRQDDIDAMLSSLNRAAAPPPEPPAPDILELTESMATEEPEPPEASFRTIDGQSDVVFDERPFEPAPAPPPRRSPMLDADALLSASTTSAVDSAFNTLAHTVLVQNARTLEDLVKEMLRPMLKGWLDDNLPGLVERLVRAEIERVSRGRTG